MKKSSLYAIAASRRMVRGRQLTAGEGRFGVGCFENEWLHRSQVEKQGGTAHVSIKRSRLGPM